MSVGDVMCPYGDHMIGELPLGENLLGDITWGNRHMGNPILVWGTQSALGEPDWHRGNPIFISIALHKSE